MKKYIVLSFLLSVGAWAQNPVLRDLSCSDAGASDTYACSLGTAPANYAAIQGLPVRFKANTANTGAATLNLNSLGAITIKKVAGGITTDLSDNDIRAGQWVQVVYDGTNFQMQSQLGNSASAAAQAAPRPSLNQRWGYFVYNGSGTSCTTAGVFGTIGLSGANCSGTIAAGTVDANWGTNATFTAATTLDSRAEYVGSSSYRTGRNLYYEFMGTTSSNGACGSGVCHRAFFGFTDSNGAGVTASDLPSSIAYSGFRYTNQASGNTNYRCASNDGTTTGTDADSGVAVDSNPHLFQIFSNDSLNTTTYFIDGAQVCAGLTTERPGASKNMLPIATVRNLENPSSVGKVLNFAWLFVASDK